jgi:hypothetical protein
MEGFLKENPKDSLASAFMNMLRDSIKVKPN